jgi:oligosaccharide repeat unit polymerase
MSDNTILLSIGIWSLIFSGVFLYLFRKKIVNIFDPLAVFLVMRMSTLLTATLIISLTYKFNVTTLLYFLSVVIFVVTFYLTSSNIKSKNSEVSEKQVNFLAFVAFIFLLLKIVFVIISTGSLPIFSTGGSDASIEFNESNKVTTSLLSGLGSGELFILAFILPFITKKKLRFLTYFALTLSILLLISGGKKSTLFAVGATLFFADGIRSVFTEKKNLIFFNRKNIIILLFSSVIWAIWVFVNTSSNFEENIIDFNLFIIVIDFVFSQWTTPYFIFNSPEFYDFLNSYKVNEFTYFFHSFLKPLGFPAFEASIGPALHEYQTGNLSGNGINPSFVLEGYVLFGVAVPIYALIVAFVMAKARNKLLSIKKIEYKIIFITIYMSSIYNLATDGLSFAKALWASIIIIFIIIIPIRFIIYKKI